MATSKQVGMPFRCFFQRPFDKRPLPGPLDFQKGCCHMMGNSLEYACQQLNGHPSGPQPSDGGRELQISYPPMQRQFLHDDSRQGKNYSTSVLATNYDRTPYQHPKRSPGRAFPWGTLWVEAAPHFDVSRSGPPSSCLRCKMLAFAWQLERTNVVSLGPCGLEAIVILEPQGC